MSEAGGKPNSICFLVPSLDYGGAQTQVVNLAAHLKRRQWDVKLVSMMPPRAFVEKLQAQGVEVVSLDMQQGVPDPRALFKLVSLLRRWQPDIVHSHMVHANLLGRIARIFTPRVVLISTAHNIDEGGRAREIAYRITDRLASITTNVSQAAVDRYIEVGAAPRDRIRFIPNGVDTAAFSPDDEGQLALREQLGVADDEFVWLAIGRLEEAKDYPNMLQAFAAAKHEKAKLMIAGRGPLDESLKELAKQLGLDEQVRFLGVRDDIPRLMNAADAYLMSSAWEGMPIVLLEAASTGLPIVTTDVGGNREVVLDGVSGFLVESGDSASLADRMQRVMEMPLNDRKRMGDEGRKHIEKNYGLESVVDIWEDLFREFYARKK